MVNKNILKHLWKKFKDLTLSSDSEEYQRMLAGARIYFSFMSQRSYVNFFIVLFFIIFFVSILFSMSYLTTGTEPPFMPLIPVVVFYVLLTITSTLYGISREHGFSIRKGIKIFFRSPLVLVELIVVIICYTVILTFIPGTFILYNVLIFLGLIFGVLLFLFFMELIRGLESPSLIKYAKEQVNKIITEEESNDEEKDKEKIILSRYQLYYFSIYRYYSMVKKEIRNLYRKDVLLLLKFDKFPILASQIIYNDTKKRKILVDILLDLEGVKPIGNTKKFLEIMDKIDTEFGKSLFSEEKDIDLKNIFQKRSLYERTRGYLLPLIPIATIIINVFLGRL